VHAGIWAGAAAPCRVCGRPLIAFGGPPAAPPRARTYGWRLCESHKCGAVAEHSAVFLTRLPQRESPVRLLRFGDELATMSENRCLGPGAPGTSRSSSRAGSSPSEGTVPSGSGSSTSASRTADASGRRSRWPCRRPGSRPCVTGRRRHCLRRGGRTHDRRAHRSGQAELALRQRGGGTKARDRLHQL
jgi:hypothetical protein